MVSGAALGYVAMFVAVLGFGSNFAPLKRIRIGDGVFFQFCMCNAVFLAPSVPLLLLQSFPPIHGLAIFGGFIWCTGNILCPTIVKFIGMGMGLILWGSSSLLCGWASGTFGLFGLRKQPVSNPLLNYIGVAISIVGLCLYLQVKTNDTRIETNPRQNHDIEDVLDDEVINKNPLLQIRRSSSNSEQYNEAYSAEVTINEVNDDSTTGLSIGDEWREETRRVIGCLLAILNGCLVGFSFDPAQYVIDNKYDGEDDSLNYVFSQFLGIFLTSWFYTILYIIYCKRINITPYVNHEIIIPATASGIIWSVAMICWFIANGQLGFPITFPIVSAGPGFVGALWGILVFKEITGARNLCMLLFAASVTIPALILVAVSH